MTKIPAVNGIYELECDSNGTYHEIVAKLIGTLLLRLAMNLMWLKLDLYIATLQLTLLKHMLRWAR